MDAHGRQFTCAPGAGAVGCYAEAHFLLNKDLVNAAKARRINLGAFVEFKLPELVNEEINQCGGRDSNTRTPAGADLESATFVHSVTPACTHYDC